MTPSHLLGYGKDDAWTVIQSDQHLRLVRPFLEDSKLREDFVVLLYDPSITVKNYFTPSIQVALHKISSLLVVKRIGPPTNRALVKYQQGIPLWKSLLHLALGPFKWWFRGYS